MKTHFRQLVSGLAALLVVAVGASAAPAAAAQPGPGLETPAATLERAISCSSGLNNATKTPILLVHGTFTTPSETWSWGYQRVLAAQGYPVCTVTLPERATIDMQTSVEYVVYAIRHMNDVSGRKISIIGHSQGGILPTWALRFWPDLAGRVDDDISLSGPQSGTAFASTYCALACPGIAHQLAVGSDWMRALGRHPLDRSVSFTSIGTRLDEIVYPAPDATSFPGATNIMVQDLCPVRAVGHLGMLSDAVAYALVTDALTHPGPADPDRVSRSACGRSDYPGIDATGRSSLLATGIAALTAFATLPYSTHEPALRSYAVTD